ncbi:MAG: MGMT family protein [Candidatus Saccharimonas sp.]
MADTKNLRDEVYRLMSLLPKGYVTTYGDVASFAGSPRAARIVGGIAHRGPDTLPWHRLVHANGRLAVGFPGGAAVQRQLLEQDGIDCDAWGVIQNFQGIRWKP